eukprot:4442080-Prymnesium_polylepis.1
MASLSVLSGPSASLIRFITIPIDVDRFGSSSVTRRALPRQRNARHARNGHGAHTHCTSPCASDAVARGGRSRRADARGRRVLRAGGVG